MAFENGPRCRASDSRLWDPGFESFAVALTVFFTLYCSISLSCINEYLVIDSGVYVYEQPSRINYSIWLDASQRSRGGVWLKRSAREVKCKALWTVLYQNLPFCIARNFDCNVNKLRSRQLSVYQGQDFDLLLMFLFQWQWLFYSQN